MFVEQPNIHTPPDDTQIWRYMDLPKLLALLRSSSLYLCRLDRLRDPWEGQWPQLMLDTLSKYLSSVPTGKPEAVPVLFSNLPKSFFVSCWHESPHESAALWDQYGHSRGLAIKSTIGKLKRSINATLSALYLGRVNYIDYERPELETTDWAKAGVISAAFLKRKSFEHEREVRVLQWELPHNDDDVDWSRAKQEATLLVNLGVLIDSVYISPESPSWLVEPVQELLRKFELPDVVVQRSELYDKTIR